MTITRRTFVIHSLLGSAALALANASHADVPLVAETDPQAAALGYKADATKVDKVKYPKYAAGQHCASCQLYQGPATGNGNCALFAGKSVHAAGWCSAYMKKA